MGIPESLSPGGRSTEGSSYPKQGTECLFQSGIFLTVVDNIGLCALGPGPKKDWGMVNKNEILRYFLK
jgi:hypothetical protein